MALTYMKMVNGIPTTIPRNTVLKTADYAAAETDECILVDCTSGNVTITLLATPPDGLPQSIIKVDTTNNYVRIVSAGSGTIVRNAEARLGAPDECLKLRAYSNNYYREN